MKPAITNGRIISNIIEKSPITIAKEKGKINNMLINGFCIISLVILFIKFPSFSVYIQKLFFKNFNDKMSFLKVDLHLNSKICHRYDKYCHYFL